MAVNAHLYFGNYITDRRQEFNALIDWLMSRLQANSSAYYPNFMLFGDLNLDYDNPARDRARIEERIKSLNGELGNLSNLQSLYLNNNSLSGDIPSNLTNLTSLTYVNLSQNQLACDQDEATIEWLRSPLNTYYDAYIARSCNLQICTNGTVVASHDTNSGLVDDCVALLDSQEALEGTTGSLNWSGSLAITSWDGVTTGGSPSRLTELDLNEESLDGSIPAELGDLSGLEVLDLSGNDLDGSIPSELGDLSSLEVLDLSGNDLDGNMPSELGSLSSLERLDLGHNSLDNNIPSELGNLSSLIYLALDHNDLDGTIPTQLGNLSNLTDMHFGRNSLWGSIPSELGNLSSLEWLDFHSNRLTGRIPTQLGNLSSLKGLYLKGNHLRGGIPSDLGDLSSLTQLYLHDNSLSGDIPSNLTSLASLTHLYLQDNQLACGQDAAVVTWMDGVTNSDYDDYIAEARSRIGSVPADGRGRLLASGQACRVGAGRRSTGNAYTDAGDLVRRTGLKPQAMESLVMAGAFDSVTPNRRQAL